MVIEEIAWGSSRGHLNKWNLLGVILIVCKNHVEFS